MKRIFLRNLWAKQNPNNNRETLMQNWIQNWLLRTSRTAWPSRAKPQKIKRKKGSRCSSFLPGATWNRERNRINWFRITGDQEKGPSFIKSLNKSRCHLQQWGTWIRQVRKLAITRLRQVVRGKSTRASTKTIVIFFDLNLITTPVCKNKNKWNYRLTMKTLLKSRKIIRWCSSRNSRGWIKCFSMSSSMSTILLGNSFTKNSCKKLRK